MRLYRSFIAAAALLAVQLSFQVSRVHAQASAPTIAIVSISPMDRLMQDVSYLLRACNVPEAGGLAMIMANQYANGLDKTRPAGVLVKLVNGQPAPLAFLPITNREQFFGALEGAGMTADDLGSGLYAFDAGGQQLYVKEHSGWLFVSQTEDGFTNIPENPATPIESLAKRYNAAVRLNVQQLPAELRKMAIEQMRQGFERSMAEQTGQSDEEKAVAEEMGKASIAQLESLIDETEEVLVGWGVEQSSQKTFFEFGGQFVAGSQLAQQIADSQNISSNFGGLLLPGAAVTMRVTSLVPDRDKALAKNNIRNGMRQLESQLDRTDKVPSKAAEAIKKFAKGLGDVLAQTIDEGKFDGGAAVTLTDNKLRMIIGGHVADGNALANEVKQLVASVGEAPDAPKFEFDYAKHKNIALHRATAPVRSEDPQAQMILGDQLNIVIGTGEKSFFLALDPDGDALVKQAIDNVAAGASVKVSPAEMSFTVSQILQFVQHVKPHPALDVAIQSIQQYADKDKIQMQSSVLPRGVLYRISVEEGVLRAAGASAKAGASGNPGF